MAILLKSTSPWLDEHKKRADLYWDIIQIFLYSLTFIIVGFNLVYWNRTLLLVGFLLVFLTFLAIIVKIILIFGIKNIRPSFVGHQAEMDTLEKLKQLPNSYYISRDPIESKNGNIDFVVFGPTGIFAIEVKGHNFKLGLSNGQLTYSGKTNYKGKNFVKQAKNGAMEVTARFKTCGLTYDIQPILVFTNAYGLRLGKKKLDNTYIIRKEWLNDIILENKKYINKKQFGKLLTCLGH